MGKRLSVMEKVRRAVEGATDAAELQRAANWLQAQARYRSQMQFRKGSKVVFTKGHARLPAGSVGTVLRVNTKTVTVRFGEFDEWRVPPSMLEPAPATAKA